MKASIRAAREASPRSKAARSTGTITGKVPAADILVNNLGIFESRPFEEIDDAAWLRFFETNVMSGVRLSRHYFPRMKQNGFGRILFISSESAVQIPSEMIHYGMTKTAQLALARGLAETTTGTGVTVNSVLPGPTRSEGVRTFVRDMARIGRGDDVAVMVFSEFGRRGRFAPCPARRR